MRICRVTGENLASLSTFEVDFEKGALGAAGLFGITGPTGAGKSTLLDAICLSLFGATPRSAGADAVPVGEAGQETAQLLSAADARHLLRRGAGAGFAATEFIGRDGRRYRAEWHARRARNKPGGALQAVTMLLTDVERQHAVVESEKPTVVRPAVEKALGLDFEQFRRSALLAQGEFAAFLKADQADRVALLEQMTGTALYSRVADLAKERANEARRELDLLEAQRSQRQPLGEAERAALMTALAEVEARGPAVTAAVAERQAGVAWWETREKLALAAREAAGALERVGTEARSLGTRRDEVARVRKALEAQAPLEHVDAAQASLQKAREVLPGAEANQREAEAAQLAVRGAAEAALRSVGQAEAALTVVGPMLNEARALDVRLAERRADRSRAGVRWEDARREAAKVEQEAQEVARSLTSAKKKETSAQERRAAQARFSTVAQGWAAAKVQVDAAAEAVASAVRDGLVLAPEEPGADEREGAVAGGAPGAGLSSGSVPAPDEAGVEGAGAVGQDALGGPLLRQARAEERSAQERFAEVSLAMQDATRAEAGVDRVALERRQERLAEHQRRQEQLVQAQRAAAEREDAKRKGQASLEQVAQEVTALDAEQTQVSGERLPEVKRARELAEARLEELRRALGMEGQRAQLKAGEACPLCGSVEHPWAAGAPHTSAREKELAAQVTQHRKDEEAAQQRLATLRASLDALGRERARLTSERARLERELEALAARWVEHLPDVDGAPRSPGPLAEVFLTQEAARLVAERDAVAQARRELEALRQALQQAQQQVERARGVAQRAKVLVEAETALARLRPVLISLPGWRAAFLQAPAAFRKSLESGVAALRQADEEAQGAKTQVAELEARAGALRERVAGTQRVVSEARAAVDSLDAQVRELEAERQTMLDGRPADEVEAALQDAVTQSRANRATAESLVVSTGQALERARDTLSRCRAEAESAGKVLATAQEGLQRALTERGLTAEAARALVKRGAPWVQEEEAALAALEQRRHQAEALAQERSRALSEHEHLAQPGVDQAAARAALETARTALAALQAERGRLGEQLRADDEVRQSAAALGTAALAQAEQVKRWETLRDLLAPRGGPDFAAYAQGITFEALLEEANHHLEDLARRYRLERAPTDKLELQVVDRELGDERRPVSSLSGGETFLVSLALALGLSSLGARGTRVESLFIDEGFGTLDPQSLDAALAVLENLQATGRKVGIISHVEAVNARLGAVIRVKKVGVGRSVVEVPGA